MVKETHAHPLQNPFLQEIARRLKAQAGLEEDLVYSILEVPPSPEIVDYAFPCFALKERFSKAPAPTAQELAHCPLVGGSITRVKAEEPTSTSMSDTTGSSGGFLKRSLKTVQLVK